MTHALEWSHRAPPSLDDFLAITEAAFSGLPAAFRALAGDIVFIVEDFAPDEVLAEMEIENPFELSGLYQGVDLTQRSVSDPSPAQAMVFLYRLPILLEWCEEGDIALGDLIRHILVHEIGHHFGLSDEKMDGILAAEE